MEDEIIEKKEEVKKKIKRWDHIPVRPTTFSEFRKLRNTNWKSDNAFVEELIKIYKIYLKSKEKREHETEK